MKRTHTWTWFTAAVVLLGAVLLHQRFGRHGVEGPPKALPQLQSAAVTSIQVRPRGGVEIRAERSKDEWKLTEPLVYPAKTAAIEGLLQKLERLTPAVHISEQERRTRPKADEEDGFAPPYATIQIQQGDYRTQVWVGAKTAPGDQVFLQVVGIEGVYVVDADLLNALPTGPNDWRDTALVDLDRLVFDRLTLTNGRIAVEVQRNPASQLWRMLGPSPARADSSRIASLLQQLQSLQAVDFVTDDPKADLEALGLQAPALQVGIWNATNPIAILQFGKSPTNDASRVYARRLGQGAVVTVSKDALSAWQTASVNDFRDPHLVTITQPVDVLAVVGADTFELRRLGTNGWRVLPQNYPADAELVSGLLSGLSQLSIAEYKKDVVIPPDLPTYGLAEPRLKYSLWATATNATGPTNLLIAELQFGTNELDKVYARRTDETSVYAIRLADFQRLPSASYQMRNRQLWSASEKDIRSVTVRQAGVTRQMVHQGPHEWSLAPGSQGVIEPVPIEETVRMLANVAATSWLGTGAEARKRFGIPDDAWRITMELKNGQALSVEFAPEQAGKPIVAAVTLDGQPWVFEFPASLYPYVTTYLRAR